MSAKEMLKESNKLFKMILSGEPVEKGTGKVNQYVIELIAAQVTMNDFTLSEYDGNQQSSTESKCNKHIVSGSLLELKEKLAELTLKYAKEHIGRNNAIQHEALHEITLIAKSIELCS